MSFVRAPNPIWFMVDLVGLPLNDQYYALFLTNVFPYVPQNVYRDPQGMTVWTGDTVRFLPNGTLPDNLYFDPSLVYRIEIRQGPNQSDPLIYEIDNFVPCCGSSGGGGNSTNFINAENQITNPQFAFVNFTAPIGSNNPQLIINSAGTYNIAPGWQLILTGAGTTTLTQLIFSGIDIIPTNPPFALRFNNNGWASATLIQTFNNNGAIWNGGGISGSVLAESQSSIQNLSMSYIPSDAGFPVPIFNNVSLQIGVFKTIGATIPVTSIPPDADPSTSAFVNISIALPPTGIVDITNVQILGQISPLVGPSPFSIPEYQQTTQEREADYLFHYYKDELIIQPKKSILTGWNFSLNPFQFNPTALTTAASQCQYIADQTILYQDASGALSTGQGLNFERFALLVSSIAGHASNRFALIQYIDPKTIMPYWGNYVSSLVRAEIFTDVNTQVRLKMRLLYRSNLPPAISVTPPISSWAPNSDPTFAAGWTALTPLNDPAYILENGNTNPDSIYTPLSYDSFLLPQCQASTQTLAVVIYTMDDMALTGIPIDSIVFDKISLVPNRFAVDSHPETFDQSLKECEFYFEKSFETYTTPLTAAAKTDLGSLSREQSIFVDANLNIIGRMFEIAFKRTKRAIPKILCYSPISGSENTVRGYIQNNGLFVGNGDIGISQWSNDFGISSNNVIFNSNNIASLFLIGPVGDLRSEGQINFHYTADATLGGPVI